MDNVFKPIPLQAYNTATISGTTYYAINPTGLDESCFSLTFTNNSNIDLYISLDGSSPFEIVLSKFYIQLFGPYSTINGWEKGQVFWFRNAAAAGGAGTGLVFLSGYYR